MRRGTGGRGDDDGTILILTIGFAVLAMLLVWVVIDASAVFLDRRDLAAAVDGAALDAAQRVDVAAVYARGADGDLPLDGGAVEAALDAYVRQNLPAAQYPGWHLTGRASGPHTVTVTGTRVVALPGYGTVTVTASADATDRTSP